MLGWVAAVRATESPSQLSPALIHRTWMTVSSGGASVVVMASTPWFAHGRATRLEPVLAALGRSHNGCVFHPLRRGRPPEYQ